MKPAIASVKTMNAKGRRLRYLIAGTTVLLMAWSGIPCAGCEMTAARAKPCCPSGSASQTGSQSSRQTAVDRSMACCHRCDHTASPVAQSPQAPAPKIVMPVPAASGSAEVQLNGCFTQTSLPPEDPPRFEAIGLFTRYCTFLI